MKRIRMIVIIIFSLIFYLSFHADAQVGTIVDSIDSHTGTFAFGVAWDGSGLWVTGSTHGYIYKISTTGQLLDSIADPAVAVSDISQGIVFDGTHLYVSCYSCDTLYQLDIPTKHVTASFGGLSPDERVSIAFNGADKLYFANGSNLNGSFIFEISSGTFIPWGGSVFARGFAFINQKLYGTNHTSIPNQSNIFETEISTGNKINNEKWCVNDPYGGLGMTYDGSHIWQSTINNQYIYKISFNPALDISDPDDESDFEIVTNPVHDRLNLIVGNTDLTEIEIYDVVGQCLKKFEFHFNNSTDVSDLPAGIYFIRAYGKNGTLTGIRKFIVDNR